MDMKRTNSEMAPSPAQMMAPSPDEMAPSPDDGPPVKCQRKDPLKMAMKYRKTGQLRVQLKEIGFYQDHRCSLGISSHHCHAIAWDCMEKTTQLQSYVQVDLVIIPFEMRESILAANREKCASDPLMPRFSPDMKYVCVSKTHFTHAQKLFYDSMFLYPRYLFNAGNLVIKLQDDDVEGKEILSSGVMAVIYGPELLRDEDARCALALADNFNCNSFNFLNAKAQM